MTDKTHYRKAFNSPYLSSADIVEPVVLTIKNVRLQGDQTKKTKDQFNTAYFVENEIRRGEQLKPMILNATNSKILKQLTGSPYIDDWQNVRVTVYVDHNVRFGKETMEGLRISPQAPEEKEVLTPDSDRWEKAVASYKQSKNINSILKRVDMSDEHIKQLMKEAEQE